PKFRQPDRIHQTHHPLPMTLRRLLLIQFVVVPHHPSFTLFPYTTLFRSLKRGAGSCRSAHRRGRARGACLSCVHEVATLPADHVCASHSHEGVRGFSWHRGGLEGSGRPVPDSIPLAFLPAFLT